MARNAPRAMRRHKLAYYPDPVGVTPGHRDPPAWAIHSAYASGGRLVVLCYADHPADEWQSARFAVEVPLRIVDGCVEVGRALARDLTDADYEDEEDYDGP